MIKDVENFAATESERNIYFAIDMCGGFIWRMNHDMGDGRIEREHHAAIDKDVEQARLDSLVLIRALSRFGVDHPLGENTGPTEQYWRWFRWWNSWKKDMSDNEWRACNAAMSRDLTSDEEVLFRPQGDWRTEEELAQLACASDPA